MLNEDSVPITQRVLVLEGVLNENAFTQVKRGLPPDAKAAECYFSRYAYADLPLPKSFNIAFDFTTPSRAESIDLVIRAATQQFAFADTQISHGWKMICWLGRSASQSNLLSELPAVSSWFESKKAVGLASLETWEALKIIQEPSNKGCMAARNEPANASRKAGLNKPGDGSSACLCAWCWARWF